MRIDNPRRDVTLLIGMILAVAIPGFLTLATVDYAQDVVPMPENPSPYGYTISLTLFFIPALIIGVWHVLRPGHVVHRKALFAASGAIAAIGFLLDIAFGYHFFVFPNQGATLGIRIPAWNWGELAFTSSGYLPIEEFGFYILGSIFVLVVYLWADLNWLPDYQPEEYEILANKQPKLIQMSTGAAVTWVLLIVAAFLYKAYGPHEYREGFPGYFIFIMVLGFLPTFLFLRGVARFVNWRAFGFTYAILVLISLMWEASLGVPYGWWDYHREQMVGIHFAAWANLPLEAILLWLVIAWDCVIAYELFRVFFHMRRRPRHALLGLPEGELSQPS